MNQTLQDIFERRSVRKYKSDQISEEDLSTILDAGKYAPSANNKQPWHFSVIQDETILDRLSSETKLLFMDSENPFLRKIGSNEDFQLYGGAPTVIVISGDAGNPNYEKDCSIAGENMMLAAKSLGISSCFTISTIFVFNGKEGDYFSKKIGIPEGYKAMASILLGYSEPEDIPAAAERREGTVNYVR